MAQWVWQLDPTKNRTEKTNYDVIMSARKKRAWLANFTTTIINTTLWRNRLDICLRCKTFPVRSQPTTEGEKEEEKVDHRAFRDVTGPSMTRTCLPHLMTSSLVHLGPCTTLYSTPIGHNILLISYHCPRLHWGTTKWRLAAVARLLS